MGKQAGSALIGTVFTLFMFCVRSCPYSAAQKSSSRKHRFRELNSGLLFDDQGLAVHLLRHSKAHDIQNRRRNVCQTAFP